MLTKLFQRECCERDLIAILDSDPSCLNSIGYIGHLRQGSPLIAAVFYQNLENSKLLLERGADVEAVGTVCLSLFVDLYVFSRQ